MSDRTRVTSEPATFALGDQMVWIAGLSAMAGLVLEVIRRSRVETDEGIVGLSLVVYIVYISVSVRAFWEAPRIVIPTTMLISAILWTISLELLDRVNGLFAILIIIAVPFATALAIRAIFPSMVDPDDFSEQPDRPLTVHTLLMRNKRLGSRSTLLTTSTEAGG